METCFEYLGDSPSLTVISDEPKWRKKVLALHASDPGKVELLPECTDDVILTHVPKSWLVVSPPAKREYTPEQMEALRARGKALAAAYPRRSE